MTWMRWLFVLVIVAELGVVAWCVRQRQQEYVPPLASLESVYPSAAEQVRKYYADLQADTTNPALWLQLAEAYQAVGLLPQSESCFLRVTELQPESSAAAFAWGRALEPLGRTAEARNAFQRALELGHAEVDRCWHHIGLCYLREESPQQAEEAFTKVREYPPSRYELAKLYYRTERAALAVPILDQLIESYPAALEPYQLRARLAADAGDAVAAQRLREQAEWANKLKDLEPKCIRPEIMAACDPEQVRNQVFQLLEEGRYDQARDMLEQLLEFRWNTQMLYTLVDLNFQQQRMAEVERLLREQLEREGPALDTWDRLGDCHLANNQLEEARQAWERALTLRTSPRVHAKLAEVHRRREDPVAAQRHAALSLEASGIDAFHQQQLTQSKLLLEKALELQAELPNSWFYLGELHRKLESNTEAAKLAYEKCLQLNPNHGRAQANLARLVSS